jgi:undecaprenyl-diphosphatase
MVSDFIAALLLAVVQGITEWIPVSSSGHLILFERLLGYEGGLKFDVALHFGTLMAVFVYFGKEITDIFRDFLVGKWKTENGKLAWMLIVASIPAAIVGFLSRDLFESTLSDVRVVVFGFAVTGMLLLVAGSSFSRRKKLGYSNGFLIGIAQAFSIIPGISRSGSTIASGILLGLDEKNAMKFSFLLSVPVVFGANIVSIGNETLPSELIWASLVSFIVGLLTIHILFKYVMVNRKNFKWFGLYCLLLAISLILYILL